jgi:hypothetical protein
MLSVCLATTRRVAGPDCTYTLSLLLSWFDREYKLVDVFVACNVLVVRNVMRSARAGIDVGIGGGWVFGVFVRVALWLVWFGAPSSASRSLAWPRVTQPSHVYDTSGFYSESFPGIILEHDKYCTINSMTI